MTGAGWVHCDEDMVDGKFLSIFALMCEQNFDIAPSMQKMFPSSSMSIR
jgi:hypothetical protein